MAEVSGLFSVVSQVKVDFPEIYLLDLFVLVKFVERNFKFMNFGFNCLYIIYDYTCFSAIQKS